ncbi:MAG: hypothetical protein ABGY75_08425 [Gemmataceae bacterium]
MNEGKKDQKKAINKSDENQPDHPAKAKEFRSMYERGVEGHVKAAKLLYEYQCELADKREFTAFWRDHLRWAKATVYRLVDVGKHFGTTPPETLAWFDLSALYLLSVKSVTPGVREKAIKQAESGKFVTHADVREWLGKKPTDPANPPRPGTVRIDKVKLDTEAKKLKLNPKTVIQLWERLGITVEFSSPKEEVA